MAKLLELVPYAYATSPDARMTLYCVSCEGFIKIGISRKMRERMRAFQTSNPFPVKMEYSASICAAAAIEAEMAAHEALKEFRHQGEWFSCTGAQARPAFREAIRRAEKLEREWDCHMREHNSVFSMRAFGIGTPVNPATVV